MKQIILSLLIVLTSSVSIAEMYSRPDGSWACITGVGSELASYRTGTEFVFYDELKADNRYAGYMHVGNGFTCEQIDQLKAGTKAFAFVFSAGAFVAKCTVAGAPLSLLLTGAALGMAAIHLKVGGLPCDEKSEHQQLQELKQISCEVALERGIECNPYEIEERYEIQNFI